MTDLSKFTTKEALFEFLKVNKKLILAEKKSAIKYADAMSGFLGLNHEGKTFTAKAFQDIMETPELDVIQAKLAINTTRLLDSHDDVHIDGLWTKTLSENKYILHLQEHCMKFDNVISDEVVASTQKMSWKQLNQPFTGSTEVLIFDSTIREDRNEDMFERYLKGYVKQHSVGMRYVTLFMCINSGEKRYEEEKKAWDKYFPMVINSDRALEQGYFFAVTEAKLVEGSAVVLGSNFATPTISVNELQPSDDTVEANKDDSRESTTDFTKIKFIN